LETDFDPRVLFFAEKLADPVPVSLPHFDTPLQFFLRRDNHHTFSQSPLRSVVRLEPFSVFSRALLDLGRVLLLDLCRPWQLTFSYGPTTPSGVEFFFAGHFSSERSFSVRHFNPSGVPWFDLAKFHPPPNFFPLGNLIGLRKRLYTIPSCFVPAASGQGQLLLQKPFSALNTEFTRFSCPFTALALGLRVIRPLLSRFALWSAGTTGSRCPARRAPLRRAAPVIRRWASAKALFRGQVWSTRASRPPNPKKPPPHPPPLENKTPPPASIPFSQTKTTTTLPSHPPKTQNQTSHQNQNNPPPTPKNPTPTTKTTPKNTLGFIFFFTSLTIWSYTITFRPHSSSQPPTPLPSPSFSHAHLSHLPPLIPPPDSPPFFRLLHPPPPPSLPPPPAPRL